MLEVCRSFACRLTRPLPQACRGRFSAVAVLCLLAVVSASASAEPPEATPEPARRKALAILIGVEDYHRLSDLRCCNNDVKLVERTLLRYGACSEIVAMTGESKEALKPTLGNILAVLDTRLRFANEDRLDRVIVFFAGHGVKGPDDRLYFAPQDCAENLIERTGVSMMTVRTMVEQCRNIGEKILILDTCHAGSRRGIARGPSGTQLAESFRGTKNVLTLASCGPDEESLELNEKGHGLFTYWLCQGLSGAADRQPYGDGNGRVDSGELESFVADNVKRGSRDLGRLQNPLAIFSDGKSWKADLAFLPLNVAEPERADTVDSLLKEAHKYLRGGNYAAAIDQINYAMGVEPDNPEAFALRGIVHLARGESRGETVVPDMAFVDFAAAIDDFDRAISMSEEVPVPGKNLAGWHFKRSNAYRQLGEFEQALQDANKVVELEPTSAQAYLNRAKVLRNMERPAEAEADEQEAGKQKQRD